MLKKIVLVLAFLAGAFMLSPTTSQATPLGAAAQLATETAPVAEQARWRRRYYRRYHFVRRHYYRRHHWRRRFY